MDFLLFPEGSLHSKLYQRMGWNKNVSSLLQCLILAVCLFAWLPLLIFSLFSQKFNLFISDFDVHVRLLISLPLLLYAGIIANERFQIVVQQFIKCNIIPEQGMQKYKAMIASAVRLSSSPWIEVLLLLFVITIGHRISGRVLPFDISAWYAVKENDHVMLTLPGYWYAFISLPIFQFILLRWYYRIIIWYRFLWQVSKLKLQLNSLHPDRAGGIGFLANSVYGLELFLMAHSFLLSGVILNLILNMNVTVWQFQTEIIMWLLILIFIPIFPTMFFVLPLARAKRNGTNAYSVVANRYVTEFRKKWIEDSGSNILGTSDIQSLADLSNSFSISSNMQIIPLGKNTIFFVLIFTALPFFPLIFTVISFNKFFGQIINMMF